MRSKGTTAHAGRFVAIAVTYALWNDEAEWFERMAKAIRREKDFDGQQLYPLHNALATLAFILKKTMAGSKPICSTVDCLGPCWISEGIAEVDFLVTHENEVLPLEVKSGLNRAIKSRWVYADKFKPSRVYRISPRNFECRDNFLNIPLYAAGLFPQLR